MKYASKISQSIERAGIIPNALVKQLKIKARGIKETLSSRIATDHECVLLSAKIRNHNRKFEPNFDSMLQRVL